MKLFHYLNQEPIYHYNTSTQVEIPKTYIEKPFRAMWVSNVMNIDIPVLTDETTYKNQIIEILDTCKEFHLNAIIFQVRTTNDAFYESTLNPYSRYLTGKEGKKPPFDVLKWIIEECHRYDIEFHAWCNPYRISSDGSKTVDEYLSTCDDLNFAKQHPEYIVLDTKGKLILNPAIPEVQQFIIDSMVELTEKYDIDGIHFDDYFYPYSGLDQNHDDNIQFKAQSLTLGDFRRAQVTNVIKGVYDAVKQTKPDVVFGVSPFGIWKNKDEHTYGSNTGKACSESYYGQYADSVLWVQKHYVDYIVPQIYWEFGHAIAPFADICDFWDEVVQDKDVSLYIGHGAYRLGSGKEWDNPQELTNQILYANAKNNVQGNVFFTYKTFHHTKEAQKGMTQLKKLLNKE